MVIKFIEQKECLEIFPKEKCVVENVQFDVRMKYFRLFDDAKVELIKRWAAINI